MKNLALMARGWPWLTLAVATLSIFLYVFSGPASPEWIFDRQAIAMGEFWRLFTGHWIHSDFEHLAWNVAALLILGILFEDSLRQWLLVILLSGALVISLWLWWNLPHLDYYCGLSGALNSLLAAGLVVQGRNGGPLIPLIVGILVSLKIAIEMTSGDALFTSTLWPPVPQAHAIGFIVGIVLGTLKRKKCLQMN